MATYPAFAGKGVATPAPVTFNKMTQTDGEAVRGQRLTSQTMFAVVITHDLLEEADVQTIQDFFDANRNATITTQTFDDGESYTGKLLTEPEVEIVSSSWRKVVQKLFATRV